jgi:dienelactone hydrolase/predicted negative regulator of RcsB-dependent stress response
MLISEKACQVRSLAARLLPGPGLRAVYTVLAKIRTVLLLTAAFTPAIVTSAQDVPLFHFTEKPGPRSVGLKVVEQYDYSRIYRPATDNLGKPIQGERARPLQTLIWYPAEKSNARSMTVGDYANLARTETSFGKPQLAAFDKQWIATMTPTLATPLWAVRDAPVTPDRFPVVIYAPGFSSWSWENADLCEYLASHGYVVIASRSEGETTRKMTQDVAGINAQARDISFLIGYAQTLSDTDMSAIAVTGYSWGGISNLFAAARDSRIDALIALDGSMRYYPDLIKQAGDVHLEQMTIPLLFFTQGEIPLEEVLERLASTKTQDPSALNAWLEGGVLNAWTHGDLITVHMQGFVHDEFCSMYQRNEDKWKHFPQEQKADYGREDGIAGYAWLARYTLEFLDGYLKHDSAALAFLKRKPAENGVPVHFMAVDYHAAKGAPASLDAFRAELGRQGFDRAADIYAAMRKEAPDFKLDESAINSWASDLMGDNHLPEAIELFKLNVTLYPESSNVYENLGDAYLESGQKELAIESYKKSLERNPTNNDTRGKLKDLQGSPPAAQRR